MLPNCRGGWLCCWGHSEWTDLVSTILLFKVPERWQDIIRASEMKQSWDEPYSWCNFPLSSPSLLIHCPSFALPVLIALVDIPPRQPDCWGGATHAKICQNGQHSSKSKSPSPLLYIRNNVTVPSVDLCLLCDCVFLPVTRAKAVWVGLGQDSRRPLHMGSRILLVSFPALLWMISSLL